MIDGAKLDPSPLHEFNFACIAEWRSPQHNVLLEGPHESIAAVLRLLTPHLCAPVICVRAEEPIELPVSDPGTLVLRDVDRLSIGDQARLLAWIDVRPRTQIVSTTVGPLFTLVACGRFDAGLYYRLNVILLNVDRRYDFGFHAGVREAHPFVPYG